MKKIIVFYFVLLLFQSCDSDKKQNSEKPISIVPENEITTDFNPIFNEVESLDSFKNTEFITTLESKIDQHKNSIYACSFSLAWQEIKKEINDSIYIIESKDLELLNNSSTYKDVLNKDEVETTIEIENNKIIAKAHFLKLLPFYEELIEFNRPLDFKNSKVKSFGFHGSHKTGRIYYYLNDNDFAIKLTPKDKKHEIILIKVNEKEKSLLDYYNTYQTKTLAFKEDTIYWKHGFNHLDVVKIPFINFNIDYHFKNILDTKFSTTTDRHFNVIEAYQKTGFILNEKGAATEAYAIFGVEESIEEMSETPPPPKQMIFNNDFIIFLKRTDAEFPYFGLYITNDELMVKFENSTEN